MEWLGELLERDWGSRWGMNGQRGCGGRLGDYGMILGVNMFNINIFRKLLVQVS